jgi:FkbM family methyltransferase
MISRTILYFGFWEPNNSALIGSILKPGDVFVDVGANIGYYTLLGSSLVGAKGRVISIEASPAIFAQLQENSAMNGASNVRLVNHAVSDSVGELPLYGGTRWNRGASSTTVHEFDQEPEASVAAAPLDALLSKHEMEHIALIKIDIEGGELPVLRRLLDTLDKYPSEFMVLAELAPQVSQDRLRVVFDRFLAAGFRAFAVENEYDADWYLNWRRPAPLREVRALPSRQTDVLFVRGTSRGLSDGWQAHRFGRAGAVASLHHAIDPQ